MLPLLLLVLLAGCFGVAPVAVEGTLTGNASSLGDLQDECESGPPEVTAGKGEDVPAVGREDNYGAAKLLELYPNPATHGDAGEFVTVWFPDGANLSAYALADDHTTVSIASLLETNASALVDDTFPSLDHIDSPTLDVPDGDSTLTNGTFSAVDTFDRLERSDTNSLRLSCGDTGAGMAMTFSTAPTHTVALSDRKVFPLSDRLQLADDGDRIRLLEDGTVREVAEYDWATVSQVFDVRTDTFRPLGATDKPVVSGSGGTVETFVLPDEADRAVAFLEAAEERIFLAGYTLSSSAVVEALEDAIERGVSVRVLADGSPVGGKAGAEATTLDQLERAGADVRVIAGEKARYRYHHAKYAIVDDEALVTTENWKPAGTGGKSSRGWAVISDQDEIVDGLVDVFDADTGWVDAVPWEDHDPTLVEDESATGTHPRRFEATELPVERTELLLAPDNAESRLVEVIEGAEKTIDVKQVQISDEHFPLLDAVIDAAERGVRVRILLSSAWYAREDNQDLNERLTQQAEASDLDLEVRLAEPGSAFEKVHAKGLLVDGEYTYVGSINWNNNSLRHNREVGLLLTGEEVGDYYGAVFEADWEGRADEDDGWLLPVGLAMVVGAGALVVVVATRFLEFEPSVDDGTIGR